MQAHAVLCLCCVCCALLFSKPSQCRNQSLTKTSHWRMPFTRWITVSNTYYKYSMVFRFTAVSIRTFYLSIIANEIKSFAVEWTNELKVTRRYFLRSSRVCCLWDVRPRVSVQMRSCPSPFPGQRHLVTPIFHSILGCLLMLCLIDQLEKRKGACTWFVFWKSNLTSSGLSLYGCVIAPRWYSRHRADGWVL